MTNLAVPPEATPRSDRTPRRGLARFGLDSTSRQGLLLIGNTVATALLGVIYWGVAARRLPLETVGAGTAAISAITTISGLSQLNLFASLSVLIPGTPPRNRGSLVRRIYLVTTSLAAVGTGAVALIAPSVLGPTIGSSAWLSVLAMAFVALWTLFTLQDGALIAVGGAWVVLVTNTAFGAAKLVLLATLPVGGQSNVVLWSWYAPLIVLVPLTNLALFVRLRNDQTEVKNPVRVRLARFVTVDYASFLIAQVMTTALPVYVVAIAGPAQAAVFATCWMVSNSLDLAITNVAVAMSANIARQPHQAARLVRSLARRMAGPLILVVGALAALAPWVLRVFGAQYASSGTTVLRLLLVGCIFRTVVTFCSATTRSLRRPATVIVMHLTAAAVVLGCGLPAMRHWGMLALAVAWTASQLVAAAVAITLTARVLRRSALPVPPIESPRRL